MFPSLLPRKKCYEEKQNVRVDDFVLVQTPDAISGILLADNPKLLVKIRVTHWSTAG